jgi:hypothetical protein
VQLWQQNDFRRKTYCETSAGFDPVSEAYCQRSEEFFRNVVVTYPDNNKPDQNKTEFLPVEVVSCQADAENEDDKDTFDYTSPADLRVVSASSSAGSSPQKSQTSGSAPASPLGRLGSAISGSFGSLTELARSLF